MKICRNVGDGSDSVFGKLFLCCSVFSSRLCCAALCYCMIVLFVYLSLETGSFNPHAPHPSVPVVLPPFSIPLPVQKVIVCSAPFLCHIKEHIYRLPLLQ